MIKRLLNGIATLLTAGTVVLAVLLVGPRIAGLHVYMVLSGSMEPVYPVGSLIYVAEVEPSKLQVGQVITYRLTEDTIVTHRIVEIHTDAGASGRTSFCTKGDANDAADAELVMEEKVIGTPVFRIPYLGYLAIYMQQPNVAFAVCVILALLIILSENGHCH